MTVVWTAAGALLVTALLVLGAGLVLARMRVGPWRYGERPLEDVREAAEADVARVRSDDRRFRRDSPGANPDDL